MPCSFSHLTNHARTSSHGGQARTPLPKMFQRRHLVIAEAGGLVVDVESWIADQATSNVVDSNPYRVCRFLCTFGGSDTEKIDEPISSTTVTQSWNMNSSIAQHGRTS